MISCCLREMFKSEILYKTDNHVWSCHHLKVVLAPLQEEIFHSTFVNKPMMSLSKQLFLFKTWLCRLVCPVPKKAGRSFGCGASLWVSSCTMGRCACLRQGATCHSPSHSDKTSAERLAEPNTARRNTPLGRLLLIQSGLFHPCIRFLAYSPDWYKESRLLLSHILQYAEVISCTVRTDTTGLFTDSPPPCTHTHTQIQ